MALNYYDDRNKVVSQGLKIEYSKRADYKTPGLSKTAYWEYHRYATKQYKYIGLSEATAKACAAAKRAQYTRTLPAWEWNANTLKWEKKKNYNTYSDITATYEECMADISIVHTEGMLWEVEISVNEDVQMYSDYRWGSNEALENAFNTQVGVSGWSYDE